MNTVKQMKGILIVFGGLCLALIATCWSVPLCTWVMFSAILATILIGLDQFFLGGRLLEDFVDKVEEVC